MDAVVERLQQWGWPEWGIGLILLGWMGVNLGSRAYARWRHQEEISGHWRVLYDIVKKELLEVRVRLSNVEGNHGQCMQDLATSKLEIEALRREVDALRTPI